ncbi:fibulin-1-like [Bacillus rossius redtenbacheri]|uniref:fibulin-1-like n=1 Tax=Bacillus rossius redtenbacheri TaxID=93214 RepID=UPI002FDCD1C4
MAALVRAFLQALLLAAGLAAARGALESTFVHCCSIGSTLAAEKVQCDQYAAPVTGVSVEQQSMCLSTIEICCLRAYRDIKCLAGKRAAKQGDDCVVDTGFGGESQKDCCEACKLGLITSSMNMGCAFRKFSFGCPWEEVHRECCLESASSLALPDQNNTISSSVSEDSAADFDNLCDMLQGELCAHICVSIPRSYKCECHEGFTLMSDGKTCQQKDLPDRCAVNNPCAHKCLDTGIAVECSCRQGYQLGVDERSCYDIDECILKMDRCDPETQHCKNEPGSYICINADGQAVKPPSGQNPVNSSESNNMKCPAGYQYNKNAQVCDDIDECSLQLATCGEGSVCENTIGSYECVRRPAENCLPGYRMDPLSRSCVDLDECATGHHNCSAGERCSNVDGGFVCAPECAAGLQPGPGAGPCVDIDECTEALHDCVGQSSCINTIGSYICQTNPECPRGYRKISNVCEDIDECLTNTNVCNPAEEVCINEPGGYRCGAKPWGPVATQRPSQVPSCGAGYAYSSNRSICMDIDECSEDESPCSSNEECVNTVGSYVCNCRLGFKLDYITRACVDVNECQTNGHSCLASQRCDNTIGSYQCIRYTSCGTGYTLNAETGQCEDDDECTLKTDNCHALGPAYVCRNTLGSFRCERKRCSSKQILLPSGECKKIDCPPGYISGLYGKCVDVNECATNNPCRRNQQCVNTPGSFQCTNLFNCGVGFRLSEDGGRCMDVDECAERTHECGELQTCQNQAGGYLCQCPRGYSVQNSNDCVDIDECTKYRGQICGISSQCQNTPGSYECLCKAGFRQEPGTNQCSDIDECTERPGICHHKCINVWGSYRCLCNPGFILQNDNRTCLDIDECEKFKDRNLCIGMCVNVPGSYTCACPEGYRLGYDGRTCQDIDECATGTVCNQPHEVCANTRGSYRCNTITCPSEYVKDTEHKNRCLRAKTVCHVGNAACHQMPSTYSYNFISFVSNVAIPTSGHMDLFTMRGPHLSSTSTRFKLELLSARSAAGTQAATRDHFWLRQTSSSQAVVSLTRSVAGPQDIELQLTMDMYQLGRIVGKAVAKLIIYVSEYEY